MIGAPYFDTEAAELRVIVRGAVAAAALGPKPADHPTIGVSCLVCGEPFAAGDVTAAVPLGPADRAARSALDRGEAYEALAAEVHRRCTGATT